MTHTATPWTHLPNIGILGPDGREIARTIVPLAIPIMEAVTVAYDDAAYIVRCVNTHADLLAALEETRHTLSFVTSNPITAYELGMPRKALAQADAAIAKARTP